jgi:predicted amidohydrolase
MDKASPQLRVSIIQTDLYWENKEANLAMLEEKIWQIQGETDLILLPEMFTTGFSMNPTGLAEPVNAHTTRWMKQMAAQTGAVVAGTFMIQEAGRFYNRLLWMQPDGSSHAYDKRHLFTLAGEHEHYTRGSQHLLATLKGWKICPLICYDLRFPVWSRYNNALPYDVLIYLANWPAPRVNAWNILLRARAVENLAYCIGVNRIGTDGYDKPYTGESAVIDFKGEELFYRKNEACSPTVVLDYEQLQAFRNRFNFLADADRFML